MPCGSKKGKGKGKSKGKGRRKARAVANQYTRHICDGELCREPWLHAKVKGKIPIETFVSYYDLPVNGEKVLPDGWLYYPNERKVRCPQCIEYFNKNLG